MSDGLIRWSPRDLEPPDDEDVVEPVGRVRLADYRAGLERARGALAENQRILAELPEDSPRRRSLLLLIEAERRWVRFLEAKIARKSCKSRS